VWQPGAVKGPGLQTSVRRTRKANGFFGPDSWYMNHWMAQEKPVTVNAALAKWLAAQLPQRG
jgi:hypothetical protein